MTAKRVAVSVLAGLLFMYANVGLAEHPLLTEDPGTQGIGRSELELGFGSVQRDPAFGGNNTEAAPQLSHGLARAVDLILRGTYVTQSVPSAPATRGIGDTTLDVKWRFLETLALALALRAGIDLPTGDVQRGLTAGTAGFHLTGVMGASFDRVDLFANIAYARNRQNVARSDNFAVSVAAIGLRDALFRTSLELAAGTSSNPAQGNWPAVFRSGLIVNVRPWLLMDVGYQWPLNGGAARRVILAGLAMRW